MEDCSCHFVPVKKRLPVADVVGDSTVWERKEIKSWRSLSSFQHWVKDGSFKSVWTELLKNHHALPDLSSMQLDGSHTPAKNGGEPIGYQNRKAASTTNALFSVITTDCRYRW